MTSGSHDSLQAPDHLSESQQAAIQRLQRDENVIPAPIWLARQAYLANDAVERAHAQTDPEEFWSDRAKLVDWMEPFKEVCRFDPPAHQWFVGGKLNATVNCIDRHVYSERRNKAALIWVGEDGEEHAYTYGRLYREVNRFANTLKALDVKKGDRVIIYMPLTPEGVITMLACARIGAIHSVVYAGMGTQALKSRIEDCQAKMVVCSDFTVRRGKKVPLKPTVDEAVRDLFFVDHVIVHRRGSRPGDEPYTFESEREHDFYDIQEPHKIHCDPEPMDAEDPLFILYTSGTTGKPKGVVHSTGGYLVGVTYMARAFYQITDRDIYWSTSDIGWVVGHSFIVYGPLSCGATVFCREGVPDYPSPEVTWELCERYGVNLMFTAPHWAQKYLTGQSNGMVVDNWWQTEIAAPVLGTLPTFEARPGKVGKPLPGVQAEVVDAEGRPVPDGSGGLLILRKPLPYMMRTVWGDHARYEHYWNQIPGGVYTAGDIAVKDRDGYFAVLGRSDDVMNVAGHRIGTADVEGALVRHPAVGEAAVVGLPDPVKGERIKAFVVLRSGIEAGPGLIASLKDHVRQDLGPIATPSEIEIRASLPKTRSGKIVRRYLKAVEMGEDPGDLSTLAD